VNFQSSQHTRTVLYNSSIGSWVNRGTNVGDTMLIIRMLKEKYEALLVIFFLVFLERKNYCCIRKSGYRLDVLCVSHRNTHIALWLHRFEIFFFLIQDTTSHTSGLKRGWIWFWTVKYSVSFSGKQNKVFRKYEIQYPLLSVKSIQRYRILPLSSSTCFCKFHRRLLKSCLTAVSNNNNKNQTFYSQTS
jgi:hypothetical protein